MWWSERRALLRGALRASVGAAIGSALALSGCGFERRRPPALAFSSIALTGFEPRSPLAAELKRSLARSLRVEDTPDRAQVVLQVMGNAREKGVVASTSAALVREVQLRLRFSFRVHTPAGRELMAPTTMLLTRDMSYSEVAALGKEYEEAELVREMQTDVVSQVMRRLASVRL